MLAQQQLPLPAMGKVRKIKRVPVPAPDVTSLPKRDTSKSTQPLSIVKGKTKTLKRTKRVFDKLGQTKDTPPETDSMRIFYTSLLTQNPKSAMALKWCLERGLLKEKQTQEAILSLEMAKVKI